MRVLIAVGSLAFAAVLSGCGGGDAKSASNRYQADPNDPSSSPPSSGTGSVGGNHGAVGSSGSSCADKTGDSFSKCASAIYGDKKYSELIDTCKAAINHTGHTESEKTYATGICIGLVPSALFLSGRAQEARDLLAVACKGSNDEGRTNTAARATLITILGMGKGEGQGEKIKGAVVTFSSACDVEPGRVADRVVELSKQ